MVLDNVNILRLHVERQPLEGFHDALRCALRRRGAVAPAAAAARRLPGARRVREAALVRRPPEGRVGAAAAGMVRAAGSRPVAAGGGPSEVAGGGAERGPGGGHGGGLAGGLLETRRGGQGAAPQGPDRRQLAGGVWGRVPITLNPSIQDSIQNYSTVYY